MAVQPGKVIDSFSTPVSDPLNDFAFTVAIIADSEVEKGVYDVHTIFGKAEAVGSFIMPRGGEHYVPFIRKGLDPNTVIIGFKTAADTTFYDYFKVTGANNAITMGYMKSYSFE